MKIRKKKLHTYIELLVTRYLFKYVFMSLKFMIYYKYKYIYMRRDDDIKKLLAQMYKKKSNLKNIINRLIPLKNIGIF